MEKNTPKFNLNRKLLAIAGGAVAVIGLAAVLLWPGNIHKELTVEAGRESITANEFRKEDRGLDALFVSDMTVVDLKTPGQRNFAFLRFHTFCQYAAFSSNSFLAICHISKFFLHKLHTAIQCFHLCINGR